MDKQFADRETRRRLMAMVLRASIAMQVRSLRESRGISQDQLAHGIGTTQSAVARIENPTGAWMRVETLQKIAMFFDVALIVKFTDWPEWLRTYDGFIAPPSFEDEQLDRLGLTQDSKP